MLNHWVNQEMTLFISRLSGKWDNKCLILKPIKHQLFDTKEKLLPLVSILILTCISIQNNLSVYGEVREGCTCKTWEISYNIKMLQLAWFIILKLECPFKIYDL